MSPKLKRMLAIVGASVAGVAIVATSALAMSGNLPTLFARTDADSGGALRADPVTLGSWTEIQPGEVWTDKSVWAESMQLSDEQSDVVMTPEQYQFGVGLSAMARGDALASDIEFRDEMERFMEIKSIDGMFHENLYHTGVEFTAALGSGDITAAFERAVKDRIETGNFERLVDEAHAAGQLADGKNYIEWYGNRSNHQTFDVSEAKFFNRSYFFVGLADTAQKSMSIDVRVTTDLETGVQRLYFTIPQALVPVADENAVDAQPIRLFYQVGVNEDPEFSSIGHDYEYQEKYTVDLFAGNGFVKYTPVVAVAEGEVKKSQNVTHKVDYVSSTIMNGNEAHVELGNNGRATLSKTGNIDIINKFSVDSVHPGTADSFEYDVLFNYEKVDVLKDSYKVSVFDAGGKVVPGSITELKLEGNAVTKNAKVRLASDETLRIYDICPGIEVAITQTGRSKGYYQIMQSVDSYQSPELGVALLDEIDPGITSEFLFINGYQSPDGLRIPVYQTIENHPFRGQIFFDIEPLNGAPAPGGPQGNEACITWVEELDVQTKSTAFGPIVFSAPGEYKYRITQRIPGTDRLDHDKSRYDVTVTVTQGADGYDASYVIAHALDSLGNALNGEAVEKAMFNGTYTIKEETFVGGLGVSSTYLNGVWADDLFKALVTGEVTESLWPVDECPMFSNVKEGQVSIERQGILRALGNLVINVPGVYTYHVKEDLGNNKDIKYSTVEYKIVVTAKNDNGYIKSSYEVFTRPDDRNTSEWTGYGQANLRFANEYIGPEYRTLTITKDVVSRDPDDRKWTIDVELYDLDPVNLSRYDVTVPTDCTKLIQTKGFEENGKTGTAIRVTLGDGQTAVIKNIPKGIEYYVYEPESSLGDWEDTYSIPQRGNIDDNLNMVVTNTVINKTLPFSIGGTSKLTGGTKNDFMYFFYCLEDVADAPMPTSGESVATVIYSADKASENFAFDDIVFDKEGTYEYIVHSRVGDETGVTYDKSEYGVKVVVTRVGNTLVATPSYTLRKDAAGDAKTPFASVTGIAFAEKYASVPASGITFKGVATLDGDRWTGNLFYTITGMKRNLQHDQPGGNAPMPDRTVSLATYNDMIGKKELSFGPITIDSPGTYYYWVTQAVGTDVNVTYDEGTYQYTVVVTDVGGKLEAEVSMQWRQDNQAPWMGIDGLSCDFHSTYKRPAIGDAELKLYVVNDFVAESARDTETLFTYELTGYNGAPMPLYHNTATGSMKYAAGEIGKKQLYFPIVRYTKPGTYHYTLRQIATGVTGVTYDKTEYAIDVLVKENVNVYAAIPTFTKIKDSMGNVVNEKAGGALFENTFTVIPDVVDLSGVIGVVNGSLYKGDFNFEIEPLSGAPAPETLTTTVTLDGTAVDAQVSVVSEQSDEDGIATQSEDDDEDPDPDGAVVEVPVNFGPVQFDAVGTYKYRVRQVGPDDSDDMLYDLSEYEVTVTVTMSGGKYVATTSFVQVKNSKGEDVVVPATMGVTFSQVVYEQPAEVSEHDLGDEDFAVTYRHGSTVGETDKYTSNMVVASTQDLFMSGLKQRITIKNTTDKDIEDVSVSVVFPSGLVTTSTYESRYVEKVDKIEAGKSVTLDFVVEASMISTSIEGTYEYYVEVKADIESEDEDGEVRHILSRSNKLAVTIGELVVKPDVFTVGENKITPEGFVDAGIKYQLQIENAGPGVANDVVVNVPLPDGVVTSDGMNGNNATSYYTVIPSLGIGESKTLTFVAKAKSDKDVKLGTYDVKAQVQWAADETGIDSNVLPLSVVAKITAGSGVTTPVPPVVTPVVPELPTRLYWENVYTHLVNVTVRKNWIMDDSLNAPVPVRVQLYADGNPYGTPVMLQATGGWTHTWTKLDSTHVWTVDEVGVPNGFVKTVDNVGDYWMITNDDIQVDLRDGDLKVSFEWLIDHGREIPEEVTVQLYSDGVPFSEPVIVTEDKDWSHVWHNLDGAHDWAIDVLTDTSGFDKFVSVNGQVWTFTFDDTPIFPDPKNVSVTMFWTNDDGRERPESVSVQLYRDGEEFDTPVTLNEDNEWFFMWANLDGAYEYTVDVPDELDDFTKFVQYKGTDWEIHLNDKPIEETKTVNVVKVWDNVPQWKFEPVGKPSSGDKETDEKYGLGIYGTLGETILEERPSMVSAEIKVQLMVGGAAVGGPVALNDDNGWQYSWKDLDPENDYHVKEVTQLSDYEVFYSNEGDNWAIKNTYVPVWRETLPVKILWNVSDAGMIPASVQIQLYQDGTPYGEPVEVKKADDWTYTFESLPRGHVYNVTQVQLEDFVAEVSEEDDVIVITNRVRGDDEPTTPPDDTDPGRPGWNDPSGGEPDPGTSDDGNHGNGDQNNDNQGGNQGDGNQGDGTKPGDNQNHNGTTIPNGSNNGGVGVGSNNNGSNGQSGTGTSGGSNGNKTTGVNQNAALANPNKNNPNTGVENNSTILWIVIGVLAAVSAAGVGGYFVLRRRGVFDR